MLMPFAVAAVSPSLIAIQARPVRLPIRSRAGRKRIAATAQQRK